MRQQVRENRYLGFYKFHVLVFLCKLLCNAQHLRVKFISLYHCSQLTFCLEILTALYPIYSHVRKESVFLEVLIFKVGKNQFPLLLPLNIIFKMTYYIKKQTHGIPLLRELWVIPHLILYSYINLRQYFWKAFGRL